MRVVNKNVNDGIEKGMSLALEQAVTWDGGRKSHILFLREAPTIATSIDVFSETVPYPFRTRFLQTKRAQYIFDLLRMELENYPSTKSITQNILDR